MQKISATQAHKSAHFSSGFLGEMPTKRASRNFLFRTSRIAIDSFFPLQVAFELSVQHNIQSIVCTGFSDIALGSHDGTSHVLKLTDDASPMAGLSLNFIYFITRGGY